MMPNKQMICISRRKFEASNNPPPDRMYFSCESYKPNGNRYIWFSQKSPNEDYISEWHYFCTQKYTKGLERSIDLEGNTNIITAEFSEKTVCINPSKYKKVLKELRKNYSQIRKLDYSKRRIIVLEIFKRVLKRGDITHVICQIDSKKDVEALEKAFSILIPPEEDVDLVRDYHKKCTFMASIIESFFSGVELTEEGYKQTNTQPEMRGWDMPCWGIFDTGAIRIISEEKIQISRPNIDISL